MDQHELQLCSGRSIEKVYVRFVNLTNRIIEVIWINYSGQYERYTLLRRKQYVDINTYKSHPWIAVDVSTKDRMLLNRNYVYKPITWKEYFEASYIVYPVVPPERRITVDITLPVYSLRYRTLLQIRDLLKNPEDADKLDLPNSLIADLKKVIELKDKVTVIMSNTT